MKTLFLTLLLVLIGIVGFGQNRQEVNSLKHQLAIAKHDTSRVLIMSQLCNSYRTSAESDFAIQYGEQALKLAQKIKFLRGEAYALSFLSKANREVGNLPKALNFALKALRIAEDNGYLNEKMECFASLGVIYFDLKNYSKFINYNKMANAIKPQLSRLPDHYFEIQIASGYIKNNQWDSAYYYTKLTNHGKIPLTYDGNYQTFHRVLGWINIKLGNNAQGVNHFKRGIHTALQNGDYRNASFNSNELSGFYLKWNKIDSCVFFAKQGLLQAKQGLFNIRILESSELLAKAYKMKNDYKQAYEYQELMIKTKEGLYGAGNIQAMQTMITDDEARKKEVESAKIAYQNQLKQYSLLVGLGMVLLISFILYRNNHQKQKANQILEKTLSDLKATQAQLIQKEKLASLGELTAGIAHEIQNPLNFVNNFSEVSIELIDELKQEAPIGGLGAELIDDVVQNLEKINLHGKRAASIVKGMLEHSRMGTGERQLTDLNVLCEEYLRLSYYGMKAKDKNFQADHELISDPNLPKISVVPQDIGRVLLNLLNNAFYAVNTPTITNPKVIVSTSHSDEQVIIKVQDNGTGIPDNIKSKIFQPFFTTKPTGEGTGLGLSLAYDIVTKGHGGTMEVESVEGEGATFVVKLPM